MRIQLSDHFTVRKLLRFTMPAIGMMIFSSIYGVVDGFFVSNFVGKTSFAAVNFIMPFLMFLGAVGFMFGSGGSALVSKTMGEGDPKKANRIFSLLVYVSIGTGIALAVLGHVLIRPVAMLLGAQGELLDNSLLYGRIILMALPTYIIHLEFQNFFATAERPQLGFLATAISGVTNMVLDALLVAVFQFGLVGAAIATAVSQCIGGVIPLVYFFRPNTSLLRLRGTTPDLRALGRACANGFSELVGNLSLHLVGMLYNLQLMKYAGESGVAAYGVLLYINTVFLSVFFGYTLGAAPIVGYHYGAGNHGELKGLLKKSVGIIAVASAAMFLLAQLLATPLSMLFVGYDAALLDMTRHGLRIYAFSFLFVGFGYFTPGFFTALNDAATSATISMLRTLVAQIAAVLLLPLAFGLDGIWASVVAAEVMAMTMAVICLAAKRGKYHYW
jgi:putative MATE family efflux protein